MSVGLFKLRSFRIAIVVLLANAALPFATASAATDATRAEISFTSAVTEVVDPGEEWVDEAGIYHLRGFITSEEVSGDISGTAVVTENNDFFAPGECTEESCPSYGEVWGTVKVTDENGWWGGRWTLTFSDVPGDEYFFTSIALQGHGGNAGMSFFGEFTDLAEDSVTIEGILSTMGTPLQELNVNVTTCFTEETTVGNYLGTGAIDGFGQAEAGFIGSGGPWTHTYNLTGLVELSNDMGSVTVGFVVGAQDNGSASFGFGTFVIIEGTGAYTELYGNGRVIGAAQELSGCEYGFGVRLSLHGEAQYN